MLLELKLNHVNKRAPGHQLMKGDDADLESPSLMCVLDDLLPIENMLS